MRPFGLFVHSDPRAYGGSRQLLPRTTPRTRREHQHRPVAWVWSTTPSRSATRPERVRASVTCLTACMPSRDPRRDAHRIASRTRPLHQSTRTGVWWMVRVRRAELLRICCAKWLERRVHRRLPLGTNLSATLRTARPSALRTDVVRALPVLPSAVTASDSRRAGVHHPGEAWWPPPEGGRQGKNAPYAAGRRRAR